MTRITGWFPLWALLVAFSAYLVPEPLVGLRPAILPLLGLVLFGMGVTLNLISSRLPCDAPASSGSGWRFSSA